MREILLRSNCVILSLNRHLSVEREILSFRGHLKVCIVLESSCHDGGGAM